MNREFRVLLAMIDEAYDRHSWHGPNLRGSIRGLSAEEAARRPSRGRHSILELVLHAAYWKYAARRRMLKEKRGTFPLEGSNWFAQTEGATRRWKGALELLAGEHRALRRAIASLPASALRRNVPGSALSYPAIIRGIAAHDLYHAGQIQLIKRLIRR
ncbi:MAG TPA: DinB family protein [Bacteroidota bacterium]|nr:DinB family protein [Bacteroidota bacterium]